MCLISYYFSWSLMQQPMSRKNLSTIKEEEALRAREANTLTNFESHSSLSFPLAKDWESEALSLSICTTITFRTSVAQRLQWRTHRTTSNR